MRFATSIAEAECAEPPLVAAAFKARPAIMAEWSTSKQQQKKERRARRQPAWEKAADEAFERSGAAFMMAAAAGAFGTDARLSLVVLCGIPGCGKSTLAAALKAKGFVVVCQDALGSRQKCEAAASAALARGDKVCVDRCNHTHQQRELWLALAARADPDAACLVVHLDASPAVAKKRVMARKKHATLPAAPASLGIVDRFAKEFEPVTQPRTWRLAGAWRAADAAAAIDAVGASAVHFIISPLMHSEALADHDLALAVNARLATRARDVAAGARGALEEHRDVVKRFGRYPHRNAAMGRASTDAERAWLDSDDVPGWAKSQ